MDSSKLWEWIMTPDQDANKDILGMYFWSAINLVNVDWIDQNRIYEAIQMCIHSQQFHKIRKHIP